MASTIPVTHGGNYVHFRGRNKAPLLSKAPLVYSLPYIDDAHATLELRNGSLRYQDTLPIKTTSTAVNLYQVSVVLALRQNARLNIRGRRYENLNSPSRSEGCKSCCK